MKNLLILALLATSVYFVYSSQKGSSLLGTRAPDFELPTPAGSVKLTDFRGRWVLLNFWASWCPPCVREMPSLEALKSRMEGRGLEVLAVSVDDGWPDIDRFLARLPLTLTILLDARGQVAGKYGAFVLPQTYLIDSDGLIVKEYQGPRDWIDPAIVSEIEGYVRNKIP